MSSNFLKSLLSAPAAAEKRYDTNVIEKIEQEQIDDKYILRWTAIVDTSNVKEIKKPLRVKDLYKRAQSGFIYAPNMFGNKGLLVLFTDYRYIYDSPGIPSTTLTTAKLWYKTVQCEQDYVVACTYDPVSQKLFGLQDIIVPSMIMTNKYELPPLSVSKINKGLETIRDAIARNHCLER